MDANTKEVLLAIVALVSALGNGGLAYLALSYNAKLRRIDKLSRSINKSSDRGFPAADAGDKTYYNPDS